MSSLTSLSRIALSSLVADHTAPIASSPSGVVSHAGFIARVDDWHSFFLGLQGNKFALCLSDACELAAALLGAWHAKKLIALPGDLLPATLKQLDQLVDASIGELPTTLAAPVIGFANSALTRDELDRHSTALIIFTSGSTGTPCAIEKNIQQLDAELCALESCFGQKLANAVVYGTVSHQHIYGLLFRVLWPLATGRVFYTHRLEYPEQIATQLAGHATALVASPAHLKRLPTNLDWQPMIAGLHAVFSSGGPLAAEFADNVTRLWHQRPIEVFGSSETGGIAWRQAENGSTSWQPLPGVEWQVSNEHLLIRSPHLPNDQWFVTQDRAILREGNKFELLGRSDRIIKFEERRISLTSIENSLSQNQWVHQCRLLVLPGQRERLAGVVVLNAEGKKALKEDGKLAIVNQFRKSLASSVDPIAIPRHWRFLDALPVDSLGKTNLRVLVELFRLSMPTCSVLHQNENSVQLAFNANKDLVVFDGHFSQYAAVVPGVALVDWVVKNGRQFFAIPPHFVSIEALKFHKVIRPDTNVTLHIQWIEPKGQLLFRYESNNEVHASGRVNFSRLKIMSAATE